MAKSVLLSWIQKIHKILSSSIFTRLIFLWFIAQGVYFAVSIKFGTPPDELYHYNFIQLFAQHLPSPILSDQGTYTSLVETVKNPFFLYHYLFSFPYKLVENWSNAYIILRLLNLALGAGSLYLIAKSARLLRVSELTKNLSLFMFANTLMFVFISAAVNYDNLFIFLVLASVYLLLRLLKKVSAADLLLLAIVTLAGCLVKISFLPVALVSFIFVVSKFISVKSNLLQIIRESFRARCYFNLGLVIVLLFIGGLFAQRYVLNLATYGTYSPSCQLVRSVEDCRKNELFAREEYVRGEGRRDAPMGIVTFSKGWIHMMEERTYGVFAGSKKYILPYQYTSVLVFIVAGLSIIAFIRKFKTKDYFLITTLVISLFYLLSLLYENYSGYKDTGRIVAVQGRYALAVLPLLYLVANHYIEKLLKNMILVTGYAVIVIGVFASASLPTFLNESSSIWYKKSKLTSESSHLSINITSL